MLDMDCMMYNIDDYATYPSKTLLKSYTRIHDHLKIRIATDDVHVGFARLNQAKDNRELRRSDLFELLDEGTVHGPALAAHTRQLILAKKYSFSNELDDIARVECIAIAHTDFVYAIHCPYWPVEANEWITRRRYQCFPSKSVIKQVVRYGCDFVQVLHKLSKK